MDSGNYDNDRVGAWEAQRRIMSSLGQGVCGGSQNLCRRKQGSYACAGHFEGLQTSYLLIGALTIHEAHLQVSVVLSIESCHAEQALISWAEKETEWEALTNPALDAGKGTTEMWQSSEWLREACKLQVDKTRPQACYVLLGITGQSYYLQANTFMFASMCTTAAVWLLNSDGGYYFTMQLQT